jgi:hypothetical protein
MLNHSHRPAILFYVAHCHSDLSWYLAVETRQVANEHLITHPGARVAGKLRNRLRLVNHPSAEDHGSQ